MADFTGSSPSNTYKDILQIGNGNNGVDGTLRAVQDGKGTFTSLLLSQTTTNIQGMFQLAGQAILAVASEINFLQGVTSNIQVQLDAKTDKIIPSAVNNIAVLDATGNLADSGENITTITTIDGGLF